MECGGTTLGPRIEQGGGQRVEILGNAVDPVARTGRGAGVALEERAQVVLRKGQASGQGLEEHHARAVEVRSAGQLASLDLLRRHVRERAHDDAATTVRGQGRAHIAREPEVEQDDAPRALDDHVRGLDVAVHLSLCVEEGQARRELAHDVAHPLRLGGPLRSASTEHVIQESDSGHELHREEAVPVTGEQLVETHEVRVAEVRERPELLLEAIDLGDVHIAQRLDRDGLVPRSVVDLVDDTHRALADAREQPEAIAPRSRCAEAGELPGHR